MHDEYPNFAALCANHVEGIDFDRTIVLRKDSRIVVVAPHGGRIEPYTDVIAGDIAGMDFSLYSFRSKILASKANLHITSTKFDDPDCTKLVGAHETAISVHGCAASGERIFLGGRDKVLAVEIAKVLEAQKIRVEVGDHKFPGTDPNNVCNRTSSKAGIQCELTMPFRRGSQVPIFVAAVRKVLLDRR